MMNLMDLLQGDTGRTLINGVSQQTGAPQDKTARVLSQAMPLILGAMQRNARDTRGAQGLMGALNDSRHDGSILDNLGALLGNNPQAVQQDGAGILKHVLGGKQDHVTSALGNNTGLDSGTIMQILQFAAPVVLGMLGKNQRQSNVQDTSGLGGLLSGVLGGGAQTQQSQSMIEKFLDADGDGSIMDDVAGMVLGGGNKSGGGGLGGLLGGILGGR